MNSDMALAKKRKADCDRLCKILGTSKAFICDLLLSKVCGYPCLHPEFLERLLLQRGMMHCDESIGEALTRQYGKECADLAESLI